MGTVYSVKIGSNKRLDEDGIAKKVDDLLVTFNQYFSTYDPTSEISIINAKLQAKKAAGDLLRISGKDFVKLEVSKKFYLQLKSAMAVAKQTEGFFDPSVKPLVDLWGFSKRDNPEAIPEQSAIFKAREVVGYENISLGPENGSFYVEAPVGFALDFSAIAKGKAVDEIAELLEYNGIDDYLIDIGGEMALSGKNSKGEYFRVGVAVPAIEEPLTAASGVVIAGGEERLGVATSGDYLNYFEKNGVRYSHLINPSTGMPITHNLASVTVLAPTCEAADALATGIFVMGEEEGIAFVEKYNIPAFFIYKTTDKIGNRVFETHFSDGFAEYMKKVQNEAKKN